MKAMSSVKSERFEREGREWRNSAVEGQVLLARLFGAASAMLYKERSHMTLSSSHEANWRIVRGGGEDTEKPNDL